METKKRIIGFDLARAYAILGMYIVNFNIVFGNYHDSSWAGKLLSLFSGNSSTVFVMLAGMGMALMTNRPSYMANERKHLKTIIIKRAWFLLVLGLLLYAWWPADILHFYGGYMHIAVLFLFMDKKYYLYAAALAIAIFHLLLLWVPYDTGWNFDTLTYNDFWTFKGFLRNTFYNGWNAIFPWLAYFTIGMYLGRLDWTLVKTQRHVFVTGLVIYLTVMALQYAATHLSIQQDIQFYILADYLPPFLPFVLSTVGFGLMLIAFFMYISKYLGEKKWANNLAKTGQMTLTHYISHITLGMLLFGLITGHLAARKPYDNQPIHPLLILAFAVGYYILSYHFTKRWAKRFKNGPFESLMRKISG